MYVDPQFLYDRLTECGCTDENVSKLCWGVSNFCSLDDNPKNFEDAHCNVLKIVSANVSSSPK